MIESFLLEGVVTVEVSELVATTPELISEEIIIFCRSLNSREKAVFVQIQTTERAVVDGCLQNVYQMITSYGGDVVYGWAIWESPAIIEAIFHAVWQHPISGKYIDLTPQGDAKRVLFLPDPETEMLPDSELGKRYFAKYQDPKIESYINLLKFEEEQVRKYRDQETGEVNMHKAVKEMLLRRFKKLGNEVIKVIENERQR